MHGIGVPHHSLSVMRSRRMDEDTGPDIEEIAIIMTITIFVLLLIVKVGIWLLRDTQFWYGM